MLAAIPILLVTLLLVAGLAGFIGNIMLIVHAFQDDDTGSGVAMILQFVLPFMYFYTLYYMATRWDGTPAFKLSLGGLLGVVLYFVLSIAFVGTVGSTMSA
jgi:uncharacterized membrane protein